MRYSDYDVEEIAFHRFVAVAAGTIWGLIVTRYAFPVEARHELRNGISEYVRAHMLLSNTDVVCRLFLDFSYYYQRLVENMSLGVRDISSDRNGVEFYDERTPLLQRALLTQKSPLELFTEMETYLQVALLKV